MKKYILISFFCVVLLIIGLSLYIYLDINSKVGISSEKNIVIQKNSSFSYIFNSLEKENIISNPWIYIIISKLYSENTNKQIFAGTYKISPHNTRLQVLKALFTGNQLHIIKVTFPEGITLKEFASIASNKLEIDSIEFIKIANSDSILKLFSIPNNSIEGYLMPETYFFYWKQKPIEIIQKLIEQQNTLWNQEFATKAKELNKTRHEILTFASVIEAESPLDNEKQRIAGVFINRLKNGWKLESDPTVQYALGNKRKLSYSDLNYDNHYNTYKYHGLPPGPINSPSRSSIEAALNPEHNKYFYFVAVGDNSGSHYFSTSFSQHLAYIKQYKRNLKKHRIN